MAPFQIGRTPRHDAIVRATVADLERRLDEGWQIQPPVYRMIDPLQRSGTVYRLMLWHDGKAEVMTLGESDDVRQFAADRQLPVQDL